ncbi:uncharacterized protein [Centruroides vittatus]|uniref:uncharacterized protein n=1 Tax=Centruroides vittatus TaxID=120091 RepID=UPI0035100598
MCCQLNQCCCFLNSKDGSFASGIYTAITSFVGIIILSVEYSKFKYSISNDIACTVSLISVFVFMVTFLLLSLILLYAVAKEKRLALIPWMIWIIIVIVLQCAGAIFFLVITFIILKLIYLIPFAITIIFLGLNIICFAVVKTYYQSLDPSKLSDEESPTYTKF